MIIFIDQEKHIKLVRSMPDAGSRIMLGKISKATLEIPDEIRGLLEGEELAEVEAAIDFYKRAMAAGLQGVVGNFPATMREVFGYYRDTAGAFERRWILSAILETLRLIRKLERAEGDFEG